MIVRRAAVTEQLGLVAFPRGKPRSTIECFEFQLDVNRPSSHCEWCAGGALILTLSRVRKEQGIGASRNPLLSPRWKI